MQTKHASTSLEQYLDLSNGLRVHYKVSGRGKQTLVLVHGLGSNLKAWDKITPFLEDRYRCIALDLPAYGQSAQRDDYPYDVPFFAQAVLEFVRQLNLKNPVLAGHSMGGQTSIYAALSAPGRFHKLVLLAPAGFEQFNGAAREWLRAFYKPALLKAMPVSQIERNFRANFYDFPDDAAFMIEDRMALRADQEAYRRYCRMIPKCVMGMLDHPVYQRLPELPMPALVVYGTEDGLIPNKIINPQLNTIQVAQKGAARIPDHELHLLPRCGHFVQWECAAEAAARIKAFVG